VIEPLLGAPSGDYLSLRKRMLLGFAFLGLLMTRGLYLMGRGEWLLAAVMYVLAVSGFSGSNIFYDSSLPFVSLWPVTGFRAEETDVGPVDNAAHRLH
jgi:UMF1 family MFS transporter